MMGHSLAKLFIQIFGYLWPAYRCFKAIEHSRRSPTHGNDDLRDWCIYWFSIAVFLTAERILNLFVSWLPLYNEAKLLFVIWLWHPRTKGAVALYHSSLQPMLSQYESTIDDQLSDVQGLVSSAFHNHSGSVVQFLKDKISFLIVKAQQISNKAPSARQVDGNGRSAAAGNAQHDGFAWVGNIAQAAADRMTGDVSSGNSGSTGVRQRPAGRRQ